MFKYPDNAGKDGDYHYREDNKREIFSDERQVAAEKSAEDECRHPEDAAHYIIGKEI